MSNVGRAVEYKGHDGNWHTGAVVKEFRRYGTLQLDVDGKKVVIPAPLGGNPNSRYL